MYEQIGEVQKHFRANVSLNLNNIILLQVLPEDNNLFLILLTY